MVDETKRVPSVDADSDTDSATSSQSLSEIEQRTLDAERRLNKAEAELLDLGALRKRYRETDQRYWLRWITVGIVILIIAGMGCLLAHVAHWLPNDPKAMGAVIALHVAPIVSMTTLAIALLVAAFRGFKDGDEKAGAAIATDGARASGFLN